MPTYEYACTNAECGNRFELVQSFSDPSATECPVCRQAVRKVYGNVGVVFKGSGFYRNDSRESGKAKSTEASSSSSSEKSSSESSSTTAASSSSSSSASSSSSDSKASSASTTSSPSKTPASTPA